MLGRQFDEVERHLHVCMISGGYDPILPVPVGPIESYVYGLSKELSKKHFMNVIGFGNEHIISKNIEITAILGKSKVVSLFEKTLGVGYGLQAAFNSQVLQMIVCLHRKKPIDLLHFNVLHTAAVAAISKTLFNIPVVYSMHNLNNTALPLRICDKIIVNSEFCRDVLAKRNHMNVNKIEVLPIPLEEHMINPIEKNKAKKELNLSDYKVVLFVGRKCYEKGPQVLMDALPKVVSVFPRTIALFVGPDFAFSSRSVEFTGYLRKRAMELNIQKNVSFIGFRYGYDLKKLFCAADVFVCPSIIEEAFGKVIIEAMASNTPVIASKIGGIPELIKNNENGLLVPPNNSSELASAIIRVLRDVNFAHLIANNGQDFVLSGCYSWNCVGERCLRIYEDLL